MDKIGTLDWARATGGRLTATQALRYALRQLDQQRRILAPRRTEPDATRHPTAVDPAVPDSAFATDISRYATDHLPGPILHHSWRVWAWSHAFVPPGEHVNADLLLAASLLHDTGLSARPAGAHRRDCFTLRSADIAARILDHAGLDATSTDQVAAAIVGHMNTAPPPGADTLTTVLHAATHLDVTGARAHELSSDALAAVLARHPRDGFTSCFSGSCRRELLHAPRTRAGIAWTIGLPLALRLNPIA